jgi:hypothetical protein
METLTLNVERLKLRDNKAADLRQRRSFESGQQGCFMPEPVSALTLQFLAWVSSRPRTYADAMNAWQSTCPRHTIWEDAVTDGLVTVKSDIVALTPRGRAILNGSNDHSSATPPLTRRKVKARG